MNLKEPGEFTFSMASPMKSPTTSEPESTLTRPLAPEDVQCGQYVTIFEEIQELPSFLWSKCYCPLPPQELIHLRIKPSTAGTPLKVKALCLPFVHVQPQTGTSQILDLRKFPLALLKEGFAMSVVMGQEKSEKRGD